MSQYPALHPSSPTLSSLSQLFPYSFQPFISPPSLSSPIPAFHPSSLFVMPPSNLSSLLTVFHAYSHSLPFSSSFPSSTLFHVQSYFLFFTLSSMYRTNGVSIFIDYCTQLPATHRKAEGGERDIQLVHVNEANSCLAQGYCVYCKLAQGEWCLSSPPLFLSHSPPPC